MTKKKARAMLRKIIPRRSRTEWMPSDTVACHFCDEVKHTSAIGIGPGTFIVCVDCQKDPDRLLKLLYENLRSQEEGRGCTLPFPKKPKKRK